MKTAIRVCAALDLLNLQNKLKPIYRKEVCKEIGWTQAQMSERETWENKGGGRGTEYEKQMNKKKKKEKHRRDVGLGGCCSPLEGSKEQLW